MRLQDIRNLAVLAHGKAALVGLLLGQSGVYCAKGQAMERTMAMSGWRETAQVEMANGD